MLAHPALPRRALRFSLSTWLALFLGAASAQARIGDTPEQMSARMLQPDRGKIFSWPRDQDNRERERLRKEHPLTPFEHLLPTGTDDWREQMFWKSALHRQLSNQDGWRVHVYYLKGRSVLELYHRVGAPLNDFEINAILGLVRGGQTWRRIEKKAPGAPKTPADTVLGYDFELGAEGEGSLRARRQGDWLIIYHRRLDELLLSRKADWDATEALRRAEKAAEDEKLAPVSVEGF